MEVLTRLSGCGDDLANRPIDLLAALYRAIHLFRTDKEAWTVLMQNGMAEDFSWKKPAAEYAALYDEVARRRN